MTPDFQYFVISSMILMSMYMLYRRVQRSVMKDRSGLFDECDSILENTSKHYEANGFPYVEGDYDGFRVRFNLVPDTIVMRKIPPLWLMITIHAKQKTKGTIDFLVRPQNTEFYSPGWQWDGQIQTPINWPQNSIAKYKESVVPVGLIDRFVPKLFDDDKVKQLLVTPHALRITYMVKQAIRGEYLLMRGAIFDTQPIDKNAVKSMLESAIKIRKNIEEGNAL